MKTRDLAAKIGAPTSFDRLVRSEFGQRLLAAAEAEQDAIADRAGRARVSMPHVDALRQRVARVASQDLLQTDLPVCTRFDAADVARTASREDPRDQGLRRAALHLDRLWRQDEGGVLTIADLANLRDLYGREFPKSAVRHLFDRDILRRGFQHISDLRALSKAADQIETQQQYDDTIRALGLDGTDLASVRARAFVRAQVNRRLGENKEGARPFVAGDAADAGESVFHPDVEEQHDDALSVTDGDVKGGPKNAQATCQYCRQAPATQTLGESPDGAPSAPGMVQSPEVLLCDGCAGRLVQEYGGGVPEDTQEIQRRLRPLQSQMAPMTTQGPMNAGPSGPGITECAKCGAAVTPDVGTFALEQGGQICGDCTKMARARRAQQPSKEMPAVPPETASEPEFTPDVNQQQPDQINLSPSDAQVKAEAARRRAQADPMAILDQCASAVGWNGPSHTGHRTPEQWRDTVVSLVDNQTGFVVAEAVKAAMAGDAQTCQQKLQQAADAQSKTSMPSSSPSMGDSSPQMQPSTAQVETDDPQDAQLGENVEKLVEQHEQQNAPAERKESSMQVSRRRVEDILLAGRACSARGYGIRIASRSGREQVEVLGHDIPPMVWPMKKIVAAIEFFAQSVEASEINEQQPDAVSVPADLGEDSSSKDIENLEPGSVNEQTPGQEQSGTSKSDFEGLQTVNEQEGFPNPSVIQQGWNQPGTSTAAEGAGDQILGPHSSDDEPPDLMPTIEPASKRASAEEIRQALQGGFGDAGREGLRRGLGR